MFISRHFAQEIVNEMKRLIKHDINIMDDTGTIYASTDSERVGQLHQGAYRILHEQRDRFLVDKENKPMGTRLGINLPIEINGERVGVIGITGDPSQVAPLGDIIKRMTEIMILNASEQEKESIKDAAQSCFIENWLFSDDPGTLDLEVRGRLLGIDISARWSIVMLDVAPNPGERVSEDFHRAQMVRYIRPLLQQIPNSICSVVNQHIILLLPELTQDQITGEMNKIRNALISFSQASVRGGVSAVGRRGLEVRRCYKEARAAYKVALTLPQDQILFYKESSLEFVVDSIDQNVRGDMYEAVFSACNTDEYKEFCETIRLFFQYDGNTRLAAEALYIHKNTFCYRLNKIKRITGYSLYKPKEAALLYLASLSAGDRAE